MNIVKPDGIHTLSQHSPGLLVKVRRVALEEYRRGLIGQRAVHIDRKTVVTVHQSPLLDLTQRDRASPGCGPPQRTE